VRTRTEAQKKKHAAQERDRRKRRKAEIQEAEKRHTQKLRTAELLAAVRIGVGVYGQNAAREIVPEFAEFGSIPDLAEAMEVNRSALWQMLGFHRRQPKHNVRRFVEAYLNLSPGGMTEVMSLIEPLVKEDAG
jgi:hypothetical protein